MNLKLVINHTGYSPIAYNDRHLIQMASLTEQGITRAGLDDVPMGHEIWVRVMFSTMWFWPVQLCGPADARPTQWRMIKLILRGVQLYCINAP